MTKTNKHIIQTTNLSIGYRSKKNQTVVATEIDIQLEKGKLVAVLGKNGIGKSTLLRTLSNVQPKLGGEFFIENTPIDKMTAACLSQKMSLVLTERIPESNLTVFELIALGRQPYTNWMGTLTTEDEAFIKQAIDQVNIARISHQKCNELSDGQLQKVMIARALAQNTELIILDEPTAHLDIHHKIEVFNLLEKLVKELHKTVIISTHEVQMALQLADELWLLSESKFVAGETKSLIENGHLEKLFSTELVKFDSKSKQFIMNKSQ